MRTWEYVATPLLFGTVVLHFVDQPHSASWRSGILFDDAAHQAFGLDRGPFQSFARTLGDITFFSLMAYPALGALITGALGAGWDVAWQTFAISLEGLAVTAALLYPLQLAVHRARPYDAECLTDPAYDPDCGTSDQWRSFPSGHVAGTVTGAALICTHHLELGLWGSPWDATLCGTAIALATFTAVSRLFTNVHWMTDVLVGAAIGIIGGYVVPSALHYGF
jgi:membrane-associated phospholipid phosphatase